MPPEPPFLPKSVKTLTVTGIRSKLERAFICEKHFLAKFSVSPNKLGIQTFEYTMPTGAKEAGTLHSLFLL